MSVPCPTCLPIDCDNTEDTDLYSIESPLFPFVLNCPPGFDCGSNSFEMVCCGQLLSVQIPVNATVDERTTLIQGVLNQCGVRQLYCGDIPQLPPGTPVQLYYNVPKQCTVLCPDGSPFVYTVAAGTFLAATQAEADANAASSACVQAALRRVCLGSIPSCTCVGTAYSATIATSGGIPPFTWGIVSGSFPPGLTLNGFGVISGTPTTPGTYGFTVKVTEPDGSNVQKVFSISCIQITDTSLPTYTIGTAYSHQLAIAGGSGHYAVRIASGVLPDGLIMSVTGLITGTPTGVNAGSMPLLFDVIDTRCQTATNAFFPPRVSLVGRSRTTIATLYGYSEYTPSTPPKKYHKLEWDGEATQVGNWSFTPETFEWYLTNNVPQTETQMANAKYVYYGVGEINGVGAQVSNYNKDYYASCTKFSPEFDTNLFDYPFSLKGYCWKYDPNSCTTCSDPPPLVSNNQINSTTDLPYDFVSGSFGVTTTPTTLTQDFSQTYLIHLLNGTAFGVNNFPPATWNGIQGPWPFVATEIHTTATLTEEYTDAEALTNALIINSNGTTAETLARTTGFVSRWTTVNFDLSFTNLVVGQAYVASVFFLDSSGVTTPRNYAFTPTLTTHSITDSVPAPAQGHTITVRRPTVAFAP